MSIADSSIGFPTRIITEGKAKVLVPKLEAFVTTPSEYAPSKAPVFYNPVMELNRDFAVLALQTYQRAVNRRISVCEPLASCGVRGLRLALEVEGVREVVMGDINKKAYRLARLNIKMNELDDRVTIKNVDANFLLGSYGAPRRRFDHVDIDPFGSPVPYLDSAVRALRDGGLLALTATDMASLCGVHPKACIRKYGGRPLRTEYSHELAVRLLAGCVASIAARHGIGARVLFSFSTDHYARVYAKMEYGAKKADESLENLGHLLHCFGCFHREVSRDASLFRHASDCSECGGKLSTAGPMWVGRIIDKQFCRQMSAEALRKCLKHEVKVSKILSLSEEEAEAPASYYVIDKLCGAIGLPVPPVRRVADVLKERGFTASLTHFNSRSVKSNAPATALKETLSSIVAIGR